MSGFARIDPMALDALIDSLVQAGLNVAMIRHVLQNQHLAVKMVDVLGRHGANDMVIDLDADPFCPEGWTVAGHHRGGKWRFVQLMVDLSLQASVGRKTNMGNGPCAELVGGPILNANLLDWYLANPKYIPEEWTNQRVTFWGTAYRPPGEHELSVRFLFRDHENTWQWYSNKINDLYDINYSRYRR